MADILRGVDRAEVSKLIDQATRPLSARVQRLESRVIEFDGDPNGRIDAGPGTIGVDRSTPDAWKKLSPLGDLTGWVTI